MSNKIPNLNVFLNIWGFKHLFILFVSHTAEITEKTSVREGDGRNPNLSSCYEQNSLWPHPATEALFHFHSKL